MQTITEQATQFLEQMNEALASKDPQIAAIASAKPDDKEAMGKRMMALLTSADAMSATMQQVAMVGLGAIAIASTTIPGDLRVESNELGSGLERNFTFYRGDFRIGMLILGQMGKESGKVGGSVAVYLDEATLTYPKAPSFSSN